jgi:hypothetical protein
VSKNKVKVELFVPLGSCVCHYSGLMEKVSRATSKYNDSVDVQIKSNTSKEAREYDVLGSSCVVVDGVLKLSGDFDEAELERAIVEKTASTV